MLKKTAQFTISFLVALLLFVATSTAQRRYSGSSHTISHGGHYSGGRSGSSHKGGSYKNTRTSNHYGRHKK